MMFEVNEQVDFDFEDRNQTDLSHAKVDGQLLPTRYPTGYGASDDLNQDGVIDKLESQIKVLKRKDEI